MTVSLRCSSCGTPCKPTDAFCGACGADLTPPAQEPPAAPLETPPGSRAQESRGFNQRTMLGLPGQTSGLPQASAPAAPEPPKVDMNKAPPQKTILGMTSPFVSGPPQPLHGAKVAPLSASEKASSAKPEPEKLAQAPAHRTMLGVAPPTGSEPVTPASPAKKTMVGMAAPSVPGALVTPPRASAPPPPPSSGAPEQRVSPKSDRTMLGMPPGPTSKPAPPRPSLSSSTLHGESMPELPGSRGARPVRAALAAAAGALLVLGLGLVAWNYFAPPGLALRVVQNEQGEQLEVEVPDAAPGTRVSFLGATQEVQGSKATFPLAADALELGDNELKIGVVQGGETEQHSVHLHVAYRVRADLAGLSADPPTIAVAVDALPGSKVSIDGAPLKLDARGHAVKTYPVDAEAGSKLSFSARYRIEPKDASPAEGALALSLPVTSLQIDGPGEQATTDQTSIEVAGAVESGATVGVDGQPVKVNKGRFVQRVKLPKLGEREIRVIARVAGKVPRTTTLTVTRVADLAQAAAAFEPAPGLDYGRIAQNPVMYRGQNVAIEGRVYNVVVKAGASQIQMLARDCPTQRCPLWVELAQATDVKVDHWVRVLGQVAGEQQFRSQRGEVHTVPSVRAQYVLKLPR